MRLPRPGATLLLALALLSANASMSAAVPGYVRHRQVFLAADSLIRIGLPARASVILDSLAGMARTRDDTRMAREVEIMRAGATAASGRGAASDSVLRLLVREAESDRDTMAWCHGLRRLAFGVFARGRRSQADSILVRDRELARGARLLLEQGWAETGLGYFAIETVRPAESETWYRAAIRTFARLRDPRSALTAHVGLGRALVALQRIDAARREAAWSIAEARRLGDRPQEADLIYNLGVLEHDVGDPSLGVLYTRQALDRYRAIGWTSRAVTAANGLAIAYVNRGRLAQADSVLALVLPEAMRSEPVVRAQVLCQIGIVRRQQGRFTEAIERGREAVTIGDSLPMGRAYALIAALEASLNRAGRPAEALALIDDQLSRGGERVTPAVRTRLTLDRAEPLMRLGRPSEARAILLPAVRAWMLPVTSYTSITDIVSLGRCYRALGDRDSARIWFMRAAESWEALRRTAKDSDWRETYDNISTTFAGEYAALLLDPSRGGTAEARAEDTFAALQQFRARTLIERAAGVDSLWTAERAAAFQREVLRPGELFVDLHPTTDTTIVIVLTQDVIRAYTLPRAERSIDRMGRLTELLSDPSAGAGDVAGAASSIGGQLFGPVADLLGDARRVIIAAGALATMPLGSLSIRADGEPLIATHEVSAVPSAALLRFARARIRAARPGSRLLAVARTTDERGVALPGARREALALASTYAGAEARLDGAIGTLPKLLQDLGPWDVLHFAAHTRGDTPEPWRQALLLGTPRANIWLDATTIARRRFATRLCFMSGCGTAGRRSGTRETLAGLASAWLAAGVPTVIATQWAMDDAATYELVKRFYRNLAGGKTAAAALRSAQLEMRSQSRYAHPYYWAGVTVIGDPGTQVPLAARPRAALSLAH